MEPLTPTAPWNHARDGFKRLDEVGHLPRRDRYFGGRYVYLYALIDPRDQTVRYIGVTGKPRTRLHLHIRNQLPCLKPWFEDLFYWGFAPEMHILQKISFSVWEEVERVWIAFFKSHAKLLNHSRGGTWKDKEGETHGAPKANKAVERERKPKTPTRKRLRQRLGTSERAKSARKLEKLMMARPLKPPVPLRFE